MTDRNPLHPNALMADDVRPQLDFIIYDTQRATVLRRGTFTSCPVSRIVEGVRVSWAHATIDPNYGVNHVYLGDAGIAPKPDGTWSAANVTLPAELEHSLASPQGHDGIDMQLDGRKPYGG